MSTNDVTILIKSIRAHLDVWEEYCEYIGKGRLFKAHELTPELQRTANELGKLMGGESATKLRKPQKVAMALIAKEYDRAISIHQPMHSAHEGYAVIKEELDELWDECRKKEECRDNTAILEEAIHVGAMGLRFIVDICLKEPEAKTGDSNA